MLVYHFCKGGRTGCSSNENVIVIFFFVLTFSSLGNLFNNLPKESSCRFITYMDIISYAGRCNQLDCLVAQVWSIFLRHTELICAVFAIAYLAQRVALWHHSNARIVQDPLSSSERKWKDVCIRNLYNPNNIRKLFLDYQSKYLETYNGTPSDQLAHVKAEVAKVLTTVGNQSNKFL